MRHTYTYDCIVIGAGSGGLTVARSLARAHKKVLLIEGKRIGGDCTNVGCIPSKALLSYVYDQRKCGLAEALKYARKERQGIRREESKENLEQEGIDVVEGIGAFLDPHTIQVKKQTYSGRYIVIATGSTPQRMTIEGVPEERVITNDEFFEITEDIPHLVIIGGGYIGCEMAEAAALAGSKVSIINRDNRLLPREEPQSSILVAEQLTLLGVKIYNEAQVTEGTKSKLTVMTKEGLPVSVPYTYVLTALGRVPRVDGLDLAKARIKKERGIVVNGFSQTTQKHVFAVGDCVDGNPAFTHVANNEGRGVVRNIIFPWWKISYRHEPLPATLYTHCEIARVGPTKKELLSEYSEEEIMTSHISAGMNDRARVTQTEEGFVILHALKATGRILGGTIALPQAGEMLPRLTQAVRSGESVTSLSRQIFAYPTRADMLKRAADQSVIARLIRPMETFHAYVRTYGLRLFAGLVWATLLITFMIAKAMSGVSTLDLVKDMVAFVSMSSVGAIVYVALYAFRPLFLIPATFLTFASGVLFGLWYGFALTMVAETMSAIVGYTMARLVAGKGVLETSLGSKLKDFLSDDLFTNLLITRFAFLPFDAVNFICGALRISPLTFVITTFIGIIPGAFVFVLAGTSVNIHNFIQDARVSVDAQPLLLAGALLVVTLLFSKYLKQRSRI
ncbi:MAG: Mercuric reductase [Candidatus Parcubacteria bacterium]|jgi:pyruvate/2-oxoglutarate dehydrogenase complex dihydrolipoamide dehydrogenase (E3) component/uncharacterized membrane protein YdjX (TVP38/TMEM64 family)